MQPTMTSEKELTTELRDNVLRTLDHDDGMLRGTCEVINVKGFGAVGDGIADDTAAIQQAIVYANNHPNGHVPTLYFPEAAKYRILSTIHVPVGIAVQMAAPILFAGTGHSAALIIGEPGARNGLLRHRLNVRRESLSDWSSEECIGIQIHNAHTSHIDIVSVEGFTIGVQCVGSGRLFGYNTISLGLLLDNKIGLDLRSMMEGGCVNENLFLNGRFAASSRNHRGMSRYGIRIASADGLYVGNNNNLFVKPCFELSKAAAEPGGEVIPLLIEHGVLNRFESCCDEESTAPFARLLNGSCENEFHIGYGGMAPVIDDQSQFPSSWSTARRSLLTNLGEHVLFLSGPLAKRAGYFDGAQVHVPGVHLAFSPSSEIARAADGIGIVDDYLEIPSNRGIGVFVDTSRQKRFVVRQDVVTGYGGRIRVRCYDASGNVLPNPDPGKPHVTGYIYRKTYYNAAFGGAYVTGIDSDDDFYFCVSGEVQKIAVLLTGGTTHALHIRSFAICTVDAGFAAVWPGYEEGVPGANLAVQAPTRGAWAAGRIIFNAEPQPGEPVGWICIEGGTPGTWKSFGQIDGH